MHQPLLLLAVLGLIVAGAGCSRGGPASGAVDLKGRPSSVASIAILHPLPGTVVKGNRVRVRVQLTGGTIIPETTSQLRPDEGHLHLKVDGAVLSMTYGLEQDLLIPNGSHLVEAEFVAGDHLPFNPRVIATTTIRVE